MMPLAIKQLLKLKGRTLTIRKRTTGTYDPDTGVSAPSNNGDYAFTGTIIDYRDSLKDGDRIRQGDRKIIVSAFNLAVEPNQKDQILDGATIYNVLSVHKIVERTSVIAYICQSRV